MKDALSMTLYFCIAAFNEEKELPRLLARLDLAGKALEAQYQIIAYDDGSTDNTHTILKSFTSSPVIVLGTVENRGLGAGILGLVTYLCANARAEDYALFMDADNTHDPMLAKKFLESAEQGAELIIASRYVEGSQITGVPRHRRILSAIASLMFRLILPHRVKDFTCGFRLYRVGLLQQLFAQYGTQIVSRRGFECQLELLSKIPPRIPIKEISFKMDYSSRVGHSKMALLRTIFRTLTLFYDLICRRIGLH